MKRNFLKGIIGDQINVLLAAAAYNMKKWMNSIFGPVIFLVFHAKISENKKLKLMKVY